MLLEGGLYGCGVCVVDVQEVLDLICDGTFVGDVVFVECTVGLGKHVVERSRKR